jgi:hypothetical protein
MTKKGNQQATNTPTTIPEINEVFLIFYFNE